MKTININGSYYTIEELTKILEDAKKASPIDRVYHYHNTTEEEFLKLNGHLPSHIQGHIKETMIVAYYNKGWEPNWNNSSEYKYHPYFYMNEFRLDYVYGYYARSTVGSPLVFKSKKDCEEAVDLFFDVYKQSRLIQ